MSGTRVFELSPPGHQVRRRTMPLQRLADRVHLGHGAAHAASAAATGERVRRRAPAIPDSHVDRVVAWGKSCAAEAGQHQRCLTLIRPRVLARCRWPAE